MFPELQQNLFAVRLVYTRQEKLPFTIPIQLVSLAHKYFLSTFSIRIRPGIQDLKVETRRVRWESKSVLM